MSIRSIDSFGELLQTFRKRARITQKGLAEAIGMHRHAIVRWEQGEVLPASKAIVLEVARHLRLNDQETRQLLEASLKALTPYWSIPYPRNPFFTGRQKTLDTLYQHLGANQVIALTQIRAIHGLGGVGKTQVALEYAYQHALEYTAVFWIGAETDEQIISSFLHIASVLQLSDQNAKNQQHILTAVQNWLSAHSQWLLIWDNVEDLTVLERFLPGPRRGAILITTRRRTLGTLAQSIDLQTMEPEEGIVFLLRRARLLAPETTSEEIQQFAAQKPEQYQAATDLMNVMGGLPLALDQAGAFLEETQCGLLAYLDLFRTKRPALLQQRGEYPLDHPSSVSTTFTLAIAATTQRHPAVRELLQVCALLQADSIPEELFHLGARYLGPMLETVCQDTLEWNRVVAAACSYSLMYRQAETQTLSLHRLVQAVITDTMTENEKEQWRQRLIAALESMAPKVGTTASNHYEQLLPHVFLCLKEVQEEKLTVATLLNKTADYLHARGRYAEAENLFQRALRIRQQLLGSNHANVAALLNSLGIIYLEQNKFDRAETFFLRALHIWEETQGPEHTVTARVLNNLGLLYTNQGYYTKAEPFLLRTLAIRERLKESGPSSVAFPLNNLAILYWEQGKYSKAEPLFQRALQTWEDELGPDHSNVARALTNVAILYEDLSKYQEAEELFERALHIWEHTMGSNHFLIAHPLNELGNIKKIQGYYDEAENILQRALHIWESTLGPENHQTAGVIHDLGLLYTDQARYNEAEALFQRALHIWESSVDADHPETARILNGLANLYAKQGKEREAEALFQHALRIREQKLGPDHPHLAQTLHDIAVLHHQQGNNSEETLTFARRALYIRSQVLSKQHPKTLASYLLVEQIERSREAIQPSHREN